MRNRMCAVVAALGVWAGGAFPQEPGAPRSGLPAPGGDPFTAPIFSPTATPETYPGPPVPTLADAVGANGPRTVALPPEANDPCPCEFRTWATVELLVGRTRGPSVAPLVTTGPAGAGALAGSVGQPDTVPLFGGRRLLDDWRTGLRVELGAWLDPDRRSGVALRLYSLFTTSAQFRAVPNGAVVINVPQSVSAGGTTVQVPAFVGFPGLTTGRVAADARTTFAGGDLNWRCALERNEWGRIELLAGYRQLYLSDRLNVSFAVTPTGANAGFGSLTGSDDVRTRNSFYGPQLGLHAATAGRRVWLDGHAATALGVTVSDLDFARSRSAAGVPVARSNVSNRLTYFGVVAESGVRANWSVSDHFRLTAGYDFLYWNNVRRAQEMFVPGPVLRPQAIDFTTHLFTVGLDVRF